MTIQIAVDNEPVEPVITVPETANPVECWGGGKRQAGGHLFHWVWEEKGDGTRVWTDLVKCGTCGQKFFLRRQDSPTINQE